MALKIGELYAVLGLDDKGFQKELDKAEKGMTGLSATFFKAATANKQFEASLEESKTKVSALEKVLERHNKTVEDNKKKVSTATSTLNEAEAALAELGDEVDKTSKKYKEKQSAVESAKKALDDAKDIYAASVTDQGKLQKALDSATESLKKQETYWNKVASAAGNAGKLQQEIGSKLTKSVTAPILALGTTAAWAGINFESAFAGVEKTVDGTAAQMGELRQGIRDMAKDIPTTTTELSAIAEAAGQLGIKTNNILGFTKVMADMKETTNLGDNAATEMARFANITGMAQTNFDKLGSSIVELGNNYATTEAEIVAMSLRLGAAGKQAGMSEADILGVSASLSSLGIEAEAGGSAFSKVISSMQLASEVGGKSLTNFAKVAGMSGEQFAQVFKNDAPAALNAFITGLSSSGDSAIKILDDIGISEIRMRDALLRASSAGDLFSNAISDSNKAWKENTALTAEAEKRYKTTASRLKTLGNQAKDVGISFGDEMIPFIEKGMDSLSGLVTGFSELGDGTKSAIMYTGAFAAAVGPVTSVLGKANSGLSTIITKFRDFRTATNKAGDGYKGFGSALNGVMGPAGWLALAAAVGYGAYKLYDYASGAKAAREATEALNKTAEEWKSTQAKTIFDSGNDPYESLHLDRSIFGATPEMSKADMKELSALDKEYDKLLKKKAKQENGLNEKDQARLDEARDRRYEIRMDYALGEVTGFEEIERSVEAEVARLKALGFSDEQISASVYGDAINAANEGNIKNMDVLNAKYAEQYSLLQGIEDADERAVAQAALNAQYQKERSEALKEYADTLLSLSGLTLGTEEMAKSKTDMETLFTTLRDFAGGKINAVELEELVGDFDEGQLASYVGLLGQIQQMISTGIVSEAEVGEMFPDLAGQEGTLASILGYLQQFSDVEALSGLHSMFNEAIPQEIERVFGDVNASIGSVVVGEGVDLPVIEGLEGSLATLAKSETMTWEGEKPTIEAVVDHIINNIPEAERTFEETMLVNAVLNKDQLAEGAWLQPWHEYLATMPPVEVPAAVSFKIPERDELMEAAADTATNSGSSWLTDSVFEAVVKTNLTLEYDQDMLPHLEGLIAQDAADAIALDIPVQLSILNDNDSTSEEKTAAETRIKEYLKLFENAASYGPIGEDIAGGVAQGMGKYGWNTDASTLATTVETALREALETHSPSALTEPVGEDVAGGVGKGMTGFNFGPAANTVASNTNTRLTTAFNARLSAWRARGAYAAAGVGKGLAEYDFSGDASKMSENLLKAIAAALGINSPATKLIPSGFWSAAGMGKGFTLYDFYGDAKAGASNLTDALEKAMGSGIDSEALFAMSIQPTDALKNFARSWEDQVSLSASPAPRRAERNSSQSIVAHITDEQFTILADEVAKRTVSLSVDGRELARSNANDNSRTIREHDRRVIKGYGGR